MKEQDKTSEKELNKTEINNLPDKEFNKVLVIKMLTNLRRRMDENSENFSQEKENIKKNQLELKNTINGISNTLDGIKNRLDGASLVAQWLRICLLMRETWVRALVWEDPTCHGAAGPVSHSC